MKVNVFDFDGTIYKGDSSIDFYVFCLSKKIKIIRFLPLFFYNIVQYKLNKITKEQLKSSFFKFVSDFDDINVMVKKFWNKNKRKIKKFYLSRNHDKDIIISASPYFLLNEVCNNLHVFDLIASDVNPKTGKFNGKNCYGEEKIKRLNKKYKNITVLEAYSDSMSDRPILEIAQKSYIVKNEEIKTYRKL